MGYTKTEEAWLMVGTLNGLIAEADQVMVETLGPMDAGAAIGQKLGRGAPLRAVRDYLIDIIRSGCLSKAVEPEGYDG